MDRPSGWHNTHRGGEADPGRKEICLGQRGEAVGRDRGGIGGVIGLPQGQFQPGDVGQVAQMRDRRESRQKARHVGAVEHHHGRPGRVGAGMCDGHGGEEFLAHQLADHREGLAQRLGERDGDIVAVDVEAGPGGAAHGIGHARRDGSIRVQKCGAEGGLVHAATRFRIAVARAASAARTGQPGTSLSHSISVGFAPPARIVRA